MEHLSVTASMNGNLTALTNCLETRTVTSKRNAYVRVSSLEWEAISEVGCKATTERAAKS